MGHVFFTNSGSEAVDTALKIAVAYHRLRGEGTRTRFVGRERSYHGVNIAGISVGGVPSNRKAYSGTLLPGVDHLRHTHGLPENLFARGEPPNGAELADELEERIVARHDASNIAARDRRSGFGLGRGADAAEGLPRAPARHLHAPRHPADLRRGDHRLGPPRHRRSPRSTSASSPT